MLRPDWRTCSAQSDSPAIDSAFHHRFQAVGSIPGQSGGEFEEQGLVGEQDAGHGNVACHVDSDSPTSPGGAITPYRWDSAKCGSNEIPGWQGAIQRQSVTTRQVDCDVGRSAVRCLVRFAGCCPSWSKCCSVISRLIRTACLPAWRDAP